MQHSNEIEHVTDRTSLASVRHLSHLNLLFRKQLVAVWYLLHIPVLVTPMVSIPRLGITAVAATRSRSSIADVLVTL